jgi:hypothetical protein
MFAATGSAGDDEPAATTVTSATSAPESADRASDG